MEFHKLPRETQEVSEENDTLGGTCWQLGTSRKKLAKKKKKKRRCYEHENDRDSMSRRKFKESFTKNTAD